MAVEYNTVPEDIPLLVAEAPKKKSGGRVAAAVAALILGTAVTAKTPSVYRAASNLATCGALDCGKPTQIILDTSKAGKWAPKHDMCISVEDRSKIVPPWLGTFHFPTAEERSAFLSKCYAPSDLKAEHLPPIYEGEYENALAEKCLDPTFNLRLEKCIDGKGRQQFTIVTGGHRGSIEHELPGGQVFCFNVDRDTNSVYLGRCSSNTATCLGIGCDYFDKFELVFMVPLPCAGPGCPQDDGGIYFSMPTYDSWSGGWHGTGEPENPCMGAIAKKDAGGASLKAGKQYNAGSIHVVDCNKDVSPQYQLTWWKGT